MSSLAVRHFASQAPRATCNLKGCALCVTCYSDLTHAAKVLCAAQTIGYAQEEVADMYGFSNASMPSTVILARQHDERCGGRAGATCVAQVLLMLSDGAHVWSSAGATSITAAHALTCVSATDNEACPSRLPPVFSRQGGYLLECLC